MGDILSQEEVDALLKGTSNEQQKSSSLTDHEIDALGEIGNISMGTSATTLFTLLGQKVLITTPRVRVTNWKEISDECPTPVVVIQVEYTEGLSGSNVLILQEKDAKIITDLMMGGQGTNIEGELNDLHLSAISEAMNQMVGSSSTSLSSILKKRIDISPPKAFSILLSVDKTDGILDGTDSNDVLVKTSFRMTVGDIIDSEIMQIMPLAFAKELVKGLLDSQSSEQAEDSAKVEQQPSKETVNDVSDNTSVEKTIKPQQAVQAHADVHPVKFDNFEDDKIVVEKKNIGMIMDVPLEVTVELGRTNKAIKDILEFGPGSVVELDKLAGEPVDVLVNGKNIAKGEVVVIDESFGVRITDIIHPSKRI